MSRKYSKTFCLQKCLSRKSSISRKNPKTSSPAELSYQQVIDIPELFKDFSRLQNCLSRKSSMSRKYSKTFLPAEKCQPQIINFPETYKHFFTCKNILAANNQYPENTQRLFRLHNCLSRKSSISRKYSKTFSPAELSQPQIISIPKILKDLLAC